MIRVTGKIRVDERTLVLAVAHAARRACEDCDRDPANGTMALLTAAVYVAMRHSGKSAKALQDALADCLGEAIVAADDWFKP